MIDIHAHILPGVYYGANNLETSLALLRIAAENGTTDIIATPPVTEGDSQLEWQLIKEKTDDLNRKVSSRGIPIHVHAGAKIEMNWDMLKLLKIGGEDYCLAGSRYLLIELPANTIPRYAEAFLYEVQLRELVPIIANPERHPYLIKHPRILHGWARSGALMQCNAGSITGSFGEEIKACADLLVENNLIHFLGSCSNSVENRQTNTREAIVALAKTVTPELIQTITCTNPRAILDNTHLHFDIAQEFMRIEKNSNRLFCRIFGR